MEELLLRVGSQAANFAIRSGLGYASKFAFVQVSKFIQGAPDEATADLEKLRKRLENKIKIVTPAIDLIERIAARGNTSLSSTVQLTTALRHDINEFAKKVSDATETQQTTGTKTSAATQKQNIASVLDSMKDLLRRIEDAVPLISLALTTSGANLSSSLPDTVSPSRLLQASSLLRSADDAFERIGQTVQVGPTFIVKFYSIFTSHARVSSIKDIQWKEEYARCCACIVRVSSRAHKEGALPRKPSADSELSTLSDGYEYELRLMEDLDDGRYHEELENWSRKKMKSVVAEKGFIEGRVRHIPIARLFYEHAGILLNLGESLSPVLIAKVQHGAPHPQNVLEHFTNTGEYSEDEFDGGMASGFDSEEEEDQEDEAAKGAWMGDIEWIAFEVSQEDDSDDEEDDSDSEDTDNADDLLPALSALKLDSSPMPTSPSLPRGVSAFQQQQSSLSLLEYLLRLAALQTFEQQSHMNLTDEHIVLFLRDDNPASRQQPTLEQERTLRRRSSQTSISSDFSTRPLHHTGGQFPISPPHSDAHHHDNTNNHDISRGLTPISTPPIPISDKSAEKPTVAGPVGGKNPRTHLERAMAADYDPMTLITPISNRRVTRNGFRKPTNLVLANTKPKSEKGAHNSSSAPNSSHKPAPIGQISADEDINSNRHSANSHPSPLVGKTGRLPVRRSVSAVQKRGD